MNRFRQHVPGFVAHAPESFEFSSTADLLSREIPQRFAKTSGFFQFSMSGDLLMAEFFSGSTSHVVGTIMKPESMDLPKWIAP